MPYTCVIFRIRFMMGRNKSGEVEATAGIGNCGEAAVTKSIEREWHFTAAERLESVGSTRASLLWDEDGSESKCARHVVLVLSSF